MNASPWSQSWANIRKLEKYAVDLDTRRPIQMPVLTEKECRGVTQKLEVLKPPSSDQHAKSQPKRRLMKKRVTSSKVFRKTNWQLTQKQKVIYFSKIASNIIQISTISMIWEMSPQKWIRMSFEDTVRYSGRCQTSRVFDLVNVGVLLKLVNPETKKTSLSTYSFQRKSCIWTKKISSKIPTWKNAQNWRYKVSQLHVTHLPSRYSDPPCLHL